MTLGDWCRMHGRVACAFYLFVCYMMSLTDAAIAQDVSQVMSPTGQIGVLVGRDDEEYEEEGNPQQWDVPDGLLLPGESPDQALDRLLFEANRARMTQVPHEEEFDLQAIAGAPLSVTMPFAGGAQDVALRPRQYLQRSPEELLPSAAPYVLDPRRGPLSVADYARMTGQEQSPPMSPLQFAPQGGYLPAPRVTHDESLDLLLGGPPQIVRRPEYARLVEQSSLQGLDHRVLINRVA